ncbi:MAG TPA: kelch repeat-containing protein [Leptospiraceae bacterium]|nr:kelch repeat-containing protein [Leptospiraceae bacterium]
MDFSFTFQKSDVGGTKPSARQDHSAVRHDGFMYIFGGRNSKGEFLNDTFCLDLAEKNWTKISTKGTKPSPRYGHSATVYNGQMFICGGVTGDKKNDTEIYVLDLTAFQWSKFAVEGEMQMPDAVFGAVLSAPLWLLFGDSYACAVNLENRKKISLDIRKKKPEPVPGGGLVLYNKKIYHFSGESKQTGILDLGSVKAQSEFVDGESYNEPKPDMFSLNWVSAQTEGRKYSDRTVHGFGRLGGTVAVYGGRDSEDSLLNSVMILSLPEGKSREVTVQNLEIQDADSLAGHSTVQYGNSLFLFGGESTSGLSNDTYELLAVPAKLRKTKSKRVVPFWDKERPALPEDLPVATVLLVNSDKWEVPSSYFRATAGQSNYLNWLELDYPDIRAYLKRGDIVENVRWSGDRSYGIQFYDGHTLVPVFKEYDDYGSLSAEFKMFREFHPRYWNELNVDDRFAPGKKSQFYWHSNGVCQIMDKKAVQTAAKAGVFESEYGTYIIVNYQGLKYAVLQNCPKLKAGQLGFLYDDPKLAKSLNADFVVGPER